MATEGQSPGERVWGRLRQGPGFRARTVGSLRGRVLEIGFGHGDNFPHYRHADAVHAIEPNGAGFAAARQHQAQTARPIFLTRAAGEHLPFAAATFDTVVATLVFCSVQEPLAALQEARRVLKPGGTLRLFEHVRAPSPALAFVQDALTPSWKRLARGCHLNRDTLGTLHAAGFVVTQQRQRLAGMLLEVEARPR